MTDFYKTIKKIYEGAEAEVFIVEIAGKKYILKQRKSKRYRESELDRKIISQRLKKEAKMYEIVKRAGIICPTTVFLNLEQKQIFMTYFDCGSAKKTIMHDKTKLKNLGKSVALLHNNEIVHGDITLENMLYDTKKDLPIFIDFGLSQQSNKIDDFATDLFVFKETLCAEFPETYWDIFMTEYLKHTKNKNAIITQLEKIEKRRKYAN